MYSGSLAEASQRLLRMKMLGFDRRSFTLWKKCFSCEVKNEPGEKYLALIEQGGHIMHHLFCETMKVICILEQKR